MSSSSPRGRVKTPRPGGARVVIAAPSSPFDPARLDRGITRLSAAGFVVERPKSLLRGDHAFLNGTDDERRAALVDALTGPSDIVWLARGGYGLTRVVDALPPLPDAVPLVVGFSDATALLCALAARGVPSLHGPLATTVADESDASFAHLVDLVGGGRGHLATHAMARASDVVVDGARAGTLVAANLCVLTHLVGTSAMPRLGGAILALEETGERPYRIDRMMTQLLASGALDGVRAIVLGDFVGCVETGPSGARRVPTATEIVVERAASRGIPVFTGLPFGHGAPNFALPVGVPAVLEPDGDGARLVVTRGLFEDAA